MSTALPWQVWAVMLYPGERHRAELLTSSQRRARVTASNDLCNQAVWMTTEVQR
jgi:hypothetical protein